MPCRFQSLLATGKHLSRPNRQTVETLLALHVVNFSKIYCEPTVQHKYENFHSPTTVYSNKKYLLTY